MRTLGTLWVAAAVMGMFLAAPTRAQGLMVRGTGDVVVPLGTVHEGTVVTMNGRIQVDGELRGNALTMNGDTTITGTVTGSVRTFNGNILLGSTAKVDGDVVTANGRVDRQAGAQVGGRISEGTLFGGGPRDSAVPAPSLPGRPWGLWWTWTPGGSLWTIAASTILGVIVLALLVAVLFPAQIDRVATALATAPGLALLVGVALWALIPSLVLALVLSIVGILAIAFLPVALGVLGVIGFAGVTMLLGQRLRETIGRKRQPVFEAVLGGLVLGLLALVPWLGWVVLFLAATWGAGGVLLLLVQRFRQSVRAATSP